MNLEKQYGRKFLPTSTGEKNFFYIVQSMWFINIHTLIKSEVKKIFGKQNIF